MNNTFLDPKSDIVFKKIFGQHPDLIKSFLNSIMPFSEDGLIETIEYLALEQSPRIPVMKNTIVDVKCTDQMGRVFIVEMRMQWCDSFSKRLLFGASKAYVQQINAGEGYCSLCPVYGLGIINDVFDKQSSDWFHHYRQVNIQKPEKILEGLELIFIELPKFTPQSFMQKRLGVLWLRFLKEFKLIQSHIPEEFLQDPTLSKAVELTQESSYSKAELESYDYYLDAVRTMKTIQHDAFYTGEKSGEKMGEVMAAQKIARNMLKENMDRELVAQITGLSLEEIDKLKSSL